MAATASRKTTTGRCLTYQCWGSLYHKIDDGPYRQISFLGAGRRRSTLREFIINGCLIASSSNRWEETETHVLRLRDRAMSSPRNQENMGDAEGVMIDAKNRHEIGSFGPEIGGSAGWVLGHVQATISRM